MANVNPAARRRRLTVALVTHDDQDLVPATLACIEPVADETLIVDLGSTDRTVALAHARGTRVLEQRKGHDRSAARNDALDAASGDFVLWLEPGETMSTESAAELRAFIDRDADARTLYLLWLENPPADAHALVDQMAEPRLMPRDPQLRYRGRVRECLLPAVVEAGFAVEVREWRIERGPHVHSAAYKTRLARRERELAERSLREVGEEPRALIAQGEALVTLGEPGAAAASFERAAQVAEPQSTERLEAYYGWLTTFEGERPDTQRQLSVCLEALDAFPFDAQLLCAMGGYLQASGRLDLAGRSYKAAYEFGQIDPRTWHVRNIAEVAAACHAMVLELDQNDAEAERVLREAIERQGPSRRLQRELLELYVRRGSLEQALEQVDRLPSETPQRGELRTAVRGACLAAVGNYTAALPSLRAAHAAHCRDPLGLRWYAATLLGLGHWDVAQEVIAVWSRVEPHNDQIRQFAEVARLAGGRGAAQAERGDIGPAHRHVDPPQGIPAPALDPASRRQRVGG